MRGYTDFNPEDEYVRIQNLQNQGIPCPYCHADTGHFGACPLLASTYPAFHPKGDEKTEIFDAAKTAEPYRRDENFIPKIKEDDSVRLLGLGVLWDDRENRENDACFHPIC